MNSVALRLIPLFTAALLVQDSVVSAHAQNAPRRRGQPIHFSDPRSDIVTSNANELRANQSSLRQLDQELKKPFDLLNPADSGIPTPPLRYVPPSPAQTRQMKELLEKRNEWMLLEPDEYLKQSLGAEKMFEIPELGPEGEAKKSKTAIEKFYENLDKARLAAQASLTNQLPEHERSDSTEARERGERRQEEVFSGWTDPFKTETVDSENAGRPGPPPVSQPAFTAEFTPAKDFAQHFGFASATPAVTTEELSRSLEIRKQEIRDFLDRKSPASSPESLGSLTPASSVPLLSPAAPSVSSFSSPGAPGGFSPFSPAPGLLGAGQAGGLMPSVQNWQSQAPPVEAPRMKLPPAGFQLPQRKF